MTYPTALQKYCKKYNIPIEIYSSFREYCIWMVPKIDGREWSRYHFTLMDRIDFYLKQGSGEFIGQMPQRFGKTLICGALTISYFMGMNPDKAVLYATNTSSRAKEFTKESLYPLLFSEKYKRAFPRIKLKYQLDNEVNDISTKERRKSATLLEDRFGVLDRKGQYNARGTDTAINGIRAHLLIVDDPYANFNDAQSEIIRNKTTAWYAADAVGRSEANTLIINISTRYHDDDIIGYVIKTGERIIAEHPDYPLPEILTFRAEAEQDNEFPYDPRKKGEFLIPEFRDKYLKTKYGDPITWACVYQQNPINVNGMLLKIENLQEYLHEIQYNNVYISIDTNMKASAIDGDKAGITVWQYNHPNKYLITFVNEQYNLVDLLGCVTKLIHDYPNYAAILIEGRASGDGLADLLRTQFGRVLVVEPVKSKVERFQWCLPEFHAGNVWLPPGHKCPNIMEYKRQLLNFTGEKKNKDDLVDSTSMFLNYLRQNIVIQPNKGSLVAFKSNIPNDVRGLLTMHNVPRRYIR